MSELYEKIGSGINKIQGSFQTSQVMSQHKKIIQESGIKRTEILVQIGEEVYKKFRNEELVSAELESKVELLKELDKKIYRAKKAIADLKAQSAEVLTCPECGGNIMQDDKFCGSCGTKLELITDEETETKQCTGCEEEIPVDAVFCSCCGTKIA